MEGFENGRNQRETIDVLEDRNGDRSDIETSSSEPVEECQEDEDRSRSNVQLESDTSSTEGSFERTYDTDRCGTSSEECSRSEWPVSRGRNVGSNERDRIVPKKASQSRRKKLLPGEKKAIRKENIKAKRAERSENRGLDLKLINKRLEEFVLSNGDLLALPPICKKDHKRVSQLATVYGLRCSRSGGGKKTHPTFIPTERTAIPMGKDAERLKDFIGEKQVKGTAVTFLESGRGSPEPRSCGMSSVEGPTAPTSCMDGLRPSRGLCRSRRDGYRSHAPASTPPLFVSTGTEDMERVQAEFQANRLETIVKSRGGHASLEGFASFESHTKGFGSRLMEKMGFGGAGHGIGRDAQGRTAPVMVEIRSKRLGLGAKTC